MKSAISFLLFVAVLCGCNRYPAQLQSTEQVQAIIFEHMAWERFHGQRIDAHLPRIFLSARVESTSADADPSAAVSAYMTGIFPSTRPVSQMAPLTDIQHRVTERTTGKPGIRFRIGPFSVVEDGPTIVPADYYFDGTGAETMEYRVQRQKGRWKVTDVKRISAS